MSSVASSTTATTGSLEHEHKEGGKKRVGRDRQDLEKIVSCLESWNDPFSGPELVSLCSGKKCTPTAESDVLAGYARGEEAAKEFWSKRLQSREIDFFSPIKRLNLKHHFEASQSPSSRQPGRTSAVAADRGLFGRLLVMAQSRTFDLKLLFEHELGRIPWSLGNANGTLVSTAKSKLLQAIEKNVQPLSDVPVDAAVMVDAMALLQAFSKVPKTFGELSQQVFSQLMSYVRTDRAGRIDFVADQYHSDSIKTFERARRGDRIEPLLVSVQREDQPTPRHWKRFMSDGRNKSSLIRFFKHHWSTSSAFVPALGMSRELFITVDDACFRLYAEPTSSHLCSQQVDVLCCSHEEADTRLILHANHAISEGFEAAVIRSPDTDVAVIALGLSHSVAGRLIFRTGTQQRTRFIDLTALGVHYGPDVSSSIIGMHAFTGCDSTSAFCGKGKTKALNLITSNPSLAAAMRQLGTAISPPENLLPACEEFVCALYGKPQASHVNTLRYQLFCASTSCSPEKLPPSRDALAQHVLRANYQALIWQSALSGQPDIPGPVGHGWEKDHDGSIMICWMKQYIAPRDILRIVSCRCKTGKCESLRCVCRKESLACTDICGCISCNNPLNPPGHARQSTPTGTDPEEDNVPEHSGMDESDQCSAASTGSDSATSRSESSDES